MAGHYFYDPRPFYGHDGSNGLLPLDELFYGRYEPVPYWMDQRMAPVPAFDDYYPGQKHAAMARGLPQLQQYAYKRPESRDDIGVDMYKRSPYNFNGMAMPMPGYGGQQQRQSYDDTWVHAMTPFGPAQQHGNMPRSGADQYRQMPGQMELPMGYNMPSGNTNGNRGMEMPVNNGHMSNKGSTMGHSGSTMGHNGNTMGHSGSTMGHNGNTMGHSGSTMGHSGNTMGHSGSTMGHSGNTMHNMHNMNNPNNPNNMGNNGNGGNTGSRMTGSMGNSGSNHGSQGSKQMGGSGQQFGNKSSGGYGNGYGHGYENVKSSSAGGKSMNAKMHGSQSSQRYGGGDSSSDDSDDEYVKGHNNGMKWATKGSANHGNGHPSFSQMKSGSKGGHGYDSVSSQHKKSGGHHGGSKSGGRSQSMISKMLRFGGDSSSSDSEDEGYGHSKSKASKGSSKMGGLHGSHGSLQSYGHPQLQSKQTPYGSSHSKGVELKVPICCDNCEKKVRDCLKYMDGVENVLCDQWNRKVIVYGNVKADSVLKRVRKVKKGSELWQQGKQQQQQQQLRVY